MTRDEVMHLITQREVEEENAYRTIKNKLIAGIEVSRREISADFIETTSREVPINMGCSIGELLDDLEEDQGNYPSQERELLHISTKSELVGSASDDNGIEDLCFYVTTAVLKPNFPEVNERARRTYLSRLIKEAVEGVLRRSVFLMMDNATVNQFFNHEIEFDAIVANRVASYSR